MEDNPLTYDRWATPDDPEFAVMRVHELRKVEQACHAIWAIAKMAGNSMSALELSDARPPDIWLLSNLMGAIEILCDHISSFAEFALDEETDPQSPHRRNTYQLKHSSLVDQMVS